MVVLDFEKSGIGSQRGYELDDGFIHRLVRPDDPINLLERLTGLVLSIPVLLTSFSTKDYSSTTSTYKLLAILVLHISYLQ